MRILIVLIFQLFIIGLVVPTVYGEECHFNLSEPTGLISAQDMYNGGYGQPTICAWKIEAPNFHVIQLQFIHIDIVQTPLCLEDFIMVYDGGREVARLCGPYVPPAFQSKSRQVIIVFTPRFTETQYQFNLTYAHFKAPTCGSDEVVATGSLVPLDSDGDALYDNNLDCAWKIVSLNFALLQQLYFTEMDIQSSDMCESDYLEILDEDGTVGVYCGTQQPPLIETTTSVLYVNFHSDGSINGKGFWATYAVIDVDRQCGGLLTQPTGSIRSVDRDGDGKYDVLLNCGWAIIAPVNSLIELRFLFIDMEYEETCKFDYIQVYDSSGVWWGRHCGQPDVSRYVILSTSNILYVEFFSDTDMVGGGFRATYKHINEDLSGSSVSTKSSTSNSKTQMTPGNRSLTTADSRVSHSSTTAGLESSSHFWTSGNNSQVTSEYTTDIKQTASLSYPSTMATTSVTNPSSLAATGTIARYSEYLYMLPVTIFAYVV